MKKLENLIEIQQVDIRMTPNRKYIVTLFSKKSQKEFQHATENRIEITKDYFVKIRRNSRIPRIFRMLFGELLDKKFDVGGDYCDLAKEARVENIKLSVYDDKIEIEMKKQNRYSKHYSKEKDFNCTTTIIYDFEGKIIGGNFKVL